MKKKAPKDYAKLIPGVDYDEHAEGVDDGDEDEDFDEDEDDEDEVEAKPAKKPKQPKRARTRLEKESKPVRVRLRQRNSNKESKAEAKAWAYDVLRFVRVPVTLQNEQAWIKCSRGAKAALAAILMQHSGDNANCLPCGWAVFKRQGWTRRDTAFRHLGELFKSGLLIRSHPGSPGRMQEASAPMLKNCRNPRTKPEGVVKKRRLR